MEAREWGHAAGEPQVPPLFLTTDTCEEVARNMAASASAPRAAARCMAPVGAGTTTDGADRVAP
jgi:hypothetical protein